MGNEFARATARCAAKPDDSGGRFVVEINRTGRRSRGFEDDEMVRCKMVRWWR